MIPFVGRYRWINSYIYPAAGCFEANKWVNAVCDLEGDDMDMDMDMDNPSQPVVMDMDKSRFCSGLCNAALKSTSTGCDAKDAVEATVKTVADDALQHCSGCSAFYYEYLVACDVADDGERAPVRKDACTEGACSAECSSATKSVFTGCDANDSTEASLKTNVRNWVFKNRFEWEQGRMQFGSWKTGICLRDAAAFGPFNAGSVDG